MNEFHIMLRSDTSLEKIKQNIKQFVLLNDLEIEAIMKDDQISWQKKEFIVDTCFNRINKLPNFRWIECVIYASNEEIFIKNYLPRLEYLSYDELVFLLDNTCSTEFVVACIDTRAFERCLEEEKKNGKTFLQSLALEFKISLAEEILEKLGTTAEGNLEELGAIGEEINQLYEKRKECPKELDNAIHYYLDEIVSHISEISIESNVMKQGIEMVRKTIKKNIEISPKMLEVYILYERKALGLEDTFKELRFFVDRADTFGNYQESTGIMNIYFGYFKRIFTPIISSLNVTDRKQINALYNHSYLEHSCHELSHAVDHKKKEIIMSTSDYQENNGFLVYDQLGHGYQEILGYDGYMANHNKFPFEVRANMFSILEFSKQTSSLFAGVFSDEFLNRVSFINARRIMDFYTVESEGKRKFISPNEQFTSFIKEKANYPKEIPYYDSQDEDMMENLLLGNTLPDEILLEIEKIANGEVLTTNLYEEIVRIMNNYKKEHQEEMGTTQKS